jgi:hypothetical protein
MKCPAAKNEALASACQRALVAGAKSEGAGTRQQLRAAARRFVRRHRRDAGYLAFVLRSVAASSALAVALLGLGAEPAHAKATLFAAQTGAANPLDGQDVGRLSIPALGDLDGDGDLDLVAGELYGTFRYFKNTGSAANPAFTAQTGAANPLNGQDVGYGSAPALGDLDGDGDLDLVAGESNGTFRYFKNTGSATSPAFTAQTGAANPLNGQDVGDSAVVALGDLDGDGDLDLVAGGYDGFFHYFENTGSATSPAFAERTGAANPLNGRDVGIYSAPVVGDLDGDGDLDLVAGEEYGTFRYFENTGSATSPAFVQRTAAANPLNGQDVGSFPTPALGDLDGDGDLDLVSGENNGAFFYFVNLAGTLVPQNGAANPLNGQSLGFDSSPALGDLDGDGDPDLVAGWAYGEFFYFKNTGSAANPAFVLQTGAANPLNGQDVGSTSMPALGDLDHDGDLDLVAGDLNGTFSYFKNTGSAASPAFVLQTGAANPLNGQDVGSRAAPALGDLDGDGDLDLVVGSSSGVFAYFKNTGSAASPAFVLQTGAANPLNGQDVGQYSTPALADLDGDGDLDLVAGRQYGVFRYFENTGSKTNPAFVQRTGAANPLSGQDAGYLSTAALGDLDADGDLDLVAGDMSGAFFYFENAIVKPALSASERIGASNPLNGQDVGTFSLPALGDLDGDGDLDLVAGEAYGTFRYFKNTGTAASPAFVQMTGAANPLDGQNTGFFPTPALGDLDGDGDLDLVAGEGYGTFRYFENTGSATSPAFAERTGAANPLNGADVGNHSAPVLGDLDGDGDLDFVAGEEFGTFRYFENTGSATTPAFVQRTGAANPLDGQDAGYLSTAALGDLDRDGDLDLVAGESNGTVRYFENSGSATNPAFMVQTGAANPFDGDDVGTGSAPALGNLDGDGDLDLVVGGDNGAFRTWYLPEPGRGVLLGAGLALLERLRRRRASHRCPRTTDRTGNGRATG